MTAGGHRAKSIIKLLTTDQVSTKNREKDEIFTETVLWIHWPTLEFRSMDQNNLYSDADLRVSYFHWHPAS